MNSSTPITPARSRRKMMAIVITVILFMYMSPFSVSAEEVQEQRASGIVAFSIQPIWRSDIEIPNGTIIMSSCPCRRPSVYFETLDRIYIKKLTRAATVEVIAVGTGECGNLPAGTLTAQIQGTLVPMSVTNPAPTHGGTGKVCNALTWEHEVRW